MTIRASLFSTIIFCLAVSAAGQTVTETSYSKARAVLDKSVAAFGGLQDLRAIENVTFRSEGETIHRNQSRRTFMSERTPYEAEFIIDRNNTRYRQVQTGQYPGGFHWKNGFAIHRTEGASWDYIRKTVNPISNLPAASFRQRLRMMPHFIVLNAIERASRLRYLGKARFNDRPHEVIGYANEDGLEISLYIDEKSGLLSKIETLGTDVFSGDVVNETIFTGYRLEGTRQVPTGRLDKRGGEPTGEVKIRDLTFNAKLTDDNFKLPAEMKPPAPAPAAAPPVTEQAKNVYTVNAGGYNVLFVAFKDFVFVMEAPGGDGVSRQAIEQIRKTVPDKPIRYIAVTHHHDDHAGGIRTYIAEGATLIALPGEKTFFEKVAKSIFTFEPDSLALNPKPLKIEVVENGRRVLTDGTTTVELLDIGPGPHTDQMLVAYLPSEKMLFQGDLLNRPSNGDTPLANDTTVHFLKWIEAKDLEIDKVLAVHGPPSSLEELRGAVAAKGNE